MMKSHTIIILFKGILSKFSLSKYDFVHNGTYIMRNEFINIIISHIIRNKTISIVHNITGKETFLIRNIT